MTLASDKHHLNRSWTEVPKNQYMGKTRKKSQNQFFPKRVQWVRSDLCRKTNYKVAYGMFWLFLKSIFRSNLKVYERGVGVGFFHIHVPWCGWSFFSVHFFKSCHYVLWGKWTFFENSICHGVDDIFFNIFYRKSCLYILWGKWFFYFNWIYHSQDDHFYVILLEYGFESNTHIENSFVFVLKINFGVESSKRRSVVIFRKKITVLPENVILCRPPLWFFLSLESLEKVL